MNIQKTVGEIHARVERESREPAGFRADPGESPALRNEMAQLHGAYGRLYQMRGLIGRMPPSPNTFRARLGAFLIRIVQRMLFWYSPQIERVQLEVTSAVASLGRLVDIQAKALDSLARDVRALHASQALPPGETPRSAQGGPAAVISQLPAAFEFALQGRFRGSELDTAAKLNFWLRTIVDSGGDSGAPWLDIGCGRGEWLGLVSAAGPVVSGIDANPVSIDYCQRLGFRAERSDALDYLHRLPDETLSVVTIFHVVEHLPVEYLLQLLPLLFKKLRKGGLLAVETPNPGNLLMGSHYFWNDPTHQRPLPEALLTFMIEWAGFTVFRRAGLNHFPPENHLPWTEIDAVRQVDNLLYNSRDYGVLGRK